jgi:hypothetical protein
MYQEKVDSANFMMRNLGLSNEDTDEISEYFKKTQSNKNKQEEYDVFLEAICPSLKQRISEHLYTVTIKQNHIVKELLKPQKHRISASCLPRAHTMCS